MLLAIDIAGLLGGASTGGSPTSKPIVVQSLGEASGGNPPGTEVNASSTDACKTNLGEVSSGTSSEAQDILSFSGSDDPCNQPSSGDTTAAAGDSNCVTTDSATAALPTTAGFTDTTIQAGVSSPSAPTVTGTVSAAPAAAAKSQVITRERAAEAEAEKRVKELYRDNQGSKAVLRLREAGIPWTVMDKAGNQGVSLSQLVSGADAGFLSAFGGSYEKYYEECNDHRERLASRSGSSENQYFSCSSFRSTPYYAEMLLKSSQVNGNRDLTAFLTQNLKQVMVSSQGNRRQISRLLGTLKPIGGEDSLRSRAFSKR